MNCSTNNSKKPLSTQHGIRLTQNYIAVGINDEHLSKVSNILPTASHIDYLMGRDYYTHIFIYVIDGYITSYNQYRWVSNIKLGIKDFIFVPFDFIADVHVTNNTVITNTIYTIAELSKAFKAPVIIYPKIMYPPTKKQLYRHLCWYGKRLIHKQVFTYEALVSAALLMNKKLSDKHSNKDLHKKVLGAYMWLIENIDGFKVGLSGDELKQAHSNGQQITKAIQRERTKHLIDDAIATGNYLKVNGKVNQSQLANDLGLNRSTVIRYLSC